MDSTGTERDGCDLCGREIPLSGVEDAFGQAFCSTGCRDVNGTLGVAPKPEKERSSSERRRDTEERKAADPARDGTAEELNASGDNESDRGTTNTFFRIDGMYSATCESFLEFVAKKQAGVSDAEASYVTETVRVTHDVERISKADLRDALTTLGYTAYLREKITDTPSEPSGKTHQSRELSGMRKRRDDQILEFRYAAGLLFGAFLMVPYVAIIYPAHLSSLLDWHALDVFEGAFQLDGPGGFLFLRIYLVLTSVILFFTGMPVLRGAYISLKMRQPNTDLLVAVTAVSAFVYSTVAVLAGRNDIFYDFTLVVAASVTAVTFYESSVKQHAMNRLTDLTISQVDTARVYGPDGTTSEVPTEELTPGDRVLVRQGERIPVDGELIESDCTVDEAVVTGESLPVSKRVGDAVIGGSIVTDDAAVVRVGGGTTSSIDRLTTAVWELQSADHGVQRRADRLAARVIGPIGVVSVLVGGVGLLIGNGPLDAVLLTLLVLLIASPWGLGLATPLSVATTIEAAFDRGIIVFDETIFERLRDVDTVVFDKTGTLTTGEMEVLEADAPPALLNAAAELERRASHPAANAITSAFARNGNEAERARSDGDVPDGRKRPKEKTSRVSEFTTHATGIEGVVDGREILVGTLDLFSERGWTVPSDLEARFDEAHGFGRLPVLVGRDGAAEGVIVVGDEPRSGWDGTITRLGERGTDVVVLTGDDEAATDFFSRHAHVTHVFANVPPAGKTAAIRALKSRGQVAMVGDGTNDAPALAAADLGISLGGGTALAADAADIAIEDDTIASVETTFELADAARRRIRRNHAIALVYNAIAISVAVAGIFNPLTAAVAVLTSGALLAANSSRELLPS